MKRNLLFGTTLAGVLAGMLHWRYLLAEDERALLPENHPLALTGLLVTALAVVLVLVLTRRLPERALHRSKLSLTVRALAMGLACVACMGLDGFEQAAAGIAALAAVLTALCLWKKSLQAPADIVTVLFFPVCLLGRYRVWSAEPELHRYFFSLGALVLLMLAAYQRCAAAHGMAPGKRVWSVGCLAVFFALTAAGDPAIGWVLPVMALWQLTELGSSL